MKIINLYLAPFFALFLASGAQATTTTTNKTEYNYTILIDRNMSAIASSQIALSGLELYRAADDAVFADTDNNFLVATSYLTRLFAASYISIANHEIGGHGGRTREFDLNTSYSVGPLSGETKWSGTPHYPSSNIANTAIVAAGIQANHIFAEDIKERYLESNKINPTYGIEYLITQLDQPFYIFSTKKSDNNSSHDVANYIKNINLMYGGGENRVVSVGRVKSYAYLDLLDPFIFYSGYSYLTNSDLKKIPMIDLGGGVEYLPATRAVLAPYGLETRLVNHFRVGEKYFLVNLSRGKNAQFKSYNAQLSTNQVVHLGRFSFGTDLFYWSQPKLNAESFLNQVSQRGFMVMLNSELKVSKNFTAILSAGGKKSGFVEGYPLDSGGIIRAGFRVGI